MNLTPRFITVDDYNNYWGEDLRLMIKSNYVNESNAAEVFLYRIEDRIMNWIDNHTFRILPYDKLNPYQLEQFQKALLTQAKYVLRNGDLGLDSGYDVEKGLVIEADKLDQIIICNAAIQYLRNAGLFNLIVKNRPRVLHGYPEYGFFDNQGNGYEPYGPQPEKPFPSETKPGESGTNGSVGGLENVGYTEVNE